ncbi:MAG: site-specific integrase [Gammaproteobacteria bacterium]|nr:site-specific integrase [Gammaproteobacteria bacterium]MBU1730698.1 site-specific integrase [Gammaproteobacteria bacterium]MBU1893202.1 site-specific integrase [Gammaproteobacteria bacterium]
MPALPRNCYKTPHGFLFRITVPEAFRPAIGKREIKQALGKDYREAVTQARILSVQVDRQFSELRAQTIQQNEHQAALDAYLAKPVDKRLIAITEITPELIGGLRSLWLATLEADLAWRREGLEDADYDELQQNITEVKGMIAKALARGQPDAFIPVVRTLLVGRGYQLAITQEEERKLVLDVLPAIQEGYDILEQRQSGRLVDPPKYDTPPLRAAWEPVSSPGCNDKRETHLNANKTSAVHLFEEVINDFLGVYAKSKKTAMYRKHQPVLTMLLEVVGNKPITELRQSDLNGFFKLLGKIPPRWNDACRKRKLTVLQLAELEHPVTLGPKSFEDTYLASIRSFLKVAKKDWQDKGFPTTLTTDGQQYQGDRKEGEDKQRPFRQAELKRLFEGPEMQSYAADPAQAHCYWLPHIGLYTGARVNEICQLNPQTDILRDEESGIWYFWITDETEGHEDIAKSTKNSVSRRKTPIHSKLLDLGILAYVDSVRKQGKTLLFPLWKPVRKKASGKAEKWFVKLLRDMGLRDETTGARLVGMHAFRFTLEHKGANTKGLPWPIDHITGHAIPTISKVSRDYKGELILPNKQETLEAIQFDLAFIKPMAPER